MRLDRMMVVVAAALMQQGCFIDFNEAIPCENNAQCPGGFACDLEVGQCVGSDPEPGMAPDPQPGMGPAPAPDPQPGFQPDPMPGVEPDPQPGPQPEVNENNGDGPCPPGMAHVTGVPGLDPYCIDRFEASRVDANMTSAGTSDARATTRAGTLPWTGVNPAQAQAACIAADAKRLCSPQEWTGGCGGSEVQEFPYSTATYVVGQCNTSGRVGVTGSLPDCVFVGFQTFDMSGNVIELVDTGQGAISLKGGAFGDTNPQLLKCTNDPRPQAPIDQIGFRCCKSLP